MKIMTILGSPKKKGNTAKVLGWLEEELEKQGNQVSRTNITERKVKGCLGCLSCREKPDEPACVQKDDTMAIPVVLIHLANTEVFQKNDRKITENCMLMM